jgi:hypothetical protein
MSVATKRFLIAAVAAGAVGWFTLSALFAPRLHQPVDPEVIRSLPLESPDLVMAQSGYQQVMMPYGEVVDVGLTPTYSTAGEPVLWVHAGQGHGTPWAFYRGHWGAAFPDQLSAETIRAANARGFDWRPVSGTYTFDQYRRGL